MKNSLFAFLLVFLFSFLLFLGIRSANTSTTTTGAIDDMKTYTDIATCTEYISYMECIVDKVENEQVSTVLQKNLDSTKRVRAGLWADSENLQKICKNALFALWSQKYLQEYDCESAVQDAQAKSILDTTIWSADGDSPDQAQLWSGDVVLDGVVATWSVDKVDEIAQQPDQIVTKQVQVLQNRIWYLRVRWWAWLWFSEVGRLDLLDTVDVVGEQSGRYNIRFGPDNTTNGWVSGKYVKEVLQ